MSKHTIAFIGAGNMAGSIIGGMVNGGYAAESIIASNTNMTKLAELSSHYFIQTTHNNIEAAQGADMVVLSVKPQMMQSVVREISEVLQAKKPLVISIAAAVTTEMLEQWGAQACALVRVMPNTPVIIGEGMSGLFASDSVTDKQKNDVQAMMQTVGQVLWVEDEKDIESISALSGSGPAYFFMMMECIQAAGEGLGLSKKQAAQLTYQTALGSAKMASQSNQDIVHLREAVTSKGGTTEQALAVFQKGKLSALCVQALNAAKERAGELQKLLQQGLE